MVLLVIQSQCAGFPHRLVNSHTRNIVIAPDHPEGDEGGLGCVGGVAHNGVHPQASVSAVFR